jgi:hypothetical protein
MAGNNTNIVHVNAIQGLLSEAVKHLKEIAPDKSNAQKFSDQTIAKENAIDGLNIFQRCDVHKLQQVFE